MSEWVKLQAADGQELSAYVAKPEMTPVGSLVVIQEIFGVNPHIRRVVDEFAHHGFLAIAPALFDRIEQPDGKTVELTYEGEDMNRAYELYGKLDPTTAILDVAAAFKYVHTGELKTGTVGFCYGGFMSWLSATRGPLHGFSPSCAVGYYPGGIGSVATEEPSCPVLLHFGTNDSHIGSDQVEAVRAAHSDVKIYLYEGAEHGFNCDARSSFNPEAAALAHSRTLDFLKSNLVSAL